MLVENDQTLGVGYVVCRWCFILYAPCSVCNRVQRHFKLFNRSVEVCKHVQPRECLPPPTTLPNAATSTSSMMRGVEQVCATSVQPVFNRVQPGS